MIVKSPARLCLLPWQKLASAAGAQEDWRKGLAYTIHHHSAASQNVTTYRTTKTLSFLMSQQQPAKVS